MKNVQIAIIGVLVVVLAVLSVLIIGEYRELSQQSEKVMTSNLIEEQEPLVETQPVAEVRTATLAMIGDILLHSGLVHYEDYSSVFSPMEAVLQGYDYLIANQESLPVGNKFPVDGYPRFSSPDYLLRDLKEAGVDMVNIANNHVVDKGEAGMQTLFENLATYDMPYVGAYASQEDASVARIVELNGISVGLLSYTYGTNGLYLPQGSSFIINYIDDTKITADIIALKEQVDVTTVVMHWGPEFTTQENEEQRRLASLINEAGANIIFGMHPHVLQRYEYLQNTAGQGTHVFYSLGNYYSLTTTSANSMIGGIGSLHLTKQGDEITIAQPTLIATAMLQDADGVYRVHPLSSNEALAVQNMDWVKQVMGEGIMIQ